MTTTVTLKTHSWPVEVTTTDDYTVHGAHTVTTTKERIAPECERQFYITDSRSISFKELALPQGDAAV